MIVNGSIGNDAHSLVAFGIIGFLFVLCGFTTARAHFYVYTVMRYAHSFFYVVMPNTALPLRSFAWFVSLIVLLSMTTQIFILSSTSSYIHL